jgi:beta-1,4-mannooligosaccharide/beta-1,4-mannosyl-N-acetylglucosamine phosphorylase
MGNKELFTRHPKNPLLTPAAIPFHADAIFNPGVAEVDGEVLLLVRIEDRRGVSELRVARSSNGIDGWRLAERPLLEPDLPDHPFEEWGCEDPRVTKIADSEWIIAYTAHSRYGPAVSLARTEDFETVERLGVVLSPTNKDAAVFPGEFEGLRFMLHRPVTGGQEHIWHVCSPPDWVHWSNPGVLLPQRDGPWWDGLRVGVGAPPLLTDRGWLLIYHGVKEMGRRPIYRLGLALLDRDNPRRVLARCAQWVFSPEAEYEQRGLTPNVVYACGALTRGDDIWLYYGAADTVIGLATARTRDLLDFCLEHDYLHHVGREKGMEG